MVLKKLFKPLINSFTRDKQYSRTPEIRKKAVQNLPVADQNNLYNIALNDSDESIRAVAAHKLHDLDMLQTIIMKGTNELVKQAAQQRFFQLLCGLKHPIPDFSVREKMIRGSRNSALLEFVAEHADHVSLRELTIKKISRDPLLGNIALNDKNANIRQLAAQQIAKRSTLERVVKNSRRKDKRVYKIVKNKLDRIIEDEQRPALLAKEVVDICDSLEKLYKRKLLLQEKTTFDNYAARWNSIKNFADKDISERYNNVYNTIVEHIEELNLKQQKEHEARLNLDSLLSNLANAVDDLLNARESSQDNHELVDNSKKIISNIEQEWQKTIAGITSLDSVSTYNAKFQTILDLANSKTEATPVPENYLEKLARLCEQAENMQHKPGLILEKSIAVLHSQFKYLLDKNCLDSTEINTITNKFEQAVKQLQQRLIIQQEQVKELKLTLENNIHNTKKLLNDGLVSDAEKLLHKEIKRIEKSEIINNIEKQHYQNELKQIQSQLGNLSSWRNWAHDNERENLVKKAEQLVQQAEASTTLEKDYTDITFSVKELRQQWKKMRSHTQEELWQKFNEACNHAYEQCTPYIDKQTTIRKENLLKKEVLCQQLEDYIKTMHWPDSTDIDSKINWIKVDKITRQARKEWSAIGFVERHAHKAINKRFDKSINIIRDELKKVWQINQEQFYDLIKQVEDLHENLDDDLDGAINQAKKYQQQWKKVGPVSSYLRNKLWKKFRHACDIIFARRQQNIEQKNTINQEKLREKEAVCENLEALNQQPLKLSDLQSAYEDIKTLWHELAPQARAISQDINLRYTSALEAYQEKVQALLNEQQQLKIGLLINQADLCSQLESLKQIDESTRDSFEQQWLKLANNSLTDNHLQQRFDNALASIPNDKSALIDAELEQKNNFCLQYEILLAKDSPEQFQQARMEKQVELLNSNLGSNSLQSVNNDNLSGYELQRQWYALSNYSQDKHLQQRFTNLLTN